MSPRISECTCSAVKMTRQTNPGNTINLSWASAKIWTGDTCDFRTRIVSVCIQHISWYYLCISPSCPVYINEKKNQLKKVSSKGTCGPFQYKYFHRNSNSKETLVLQDFNYGGKLLSKSNCKQDSVGVQQTLVVSWNFGSASAGFCWCILSDNRSGYWYSCFWWKMLTDGLSRVCSW